MQPYGAPGYGGGYGQQPQPQAQPQAMFQPQPQGQQPAQPRVMFRPQPFVQPGPQFSGPQQSPTPPAVPFQPVARLENGWQSVNWQGAVVGFSRDSCGNVRVEGFVSNGRLDHPMFVLPQGFRPRGGKGFACQAAFPAGGHFPAGRRGTMNVHVYPDGRVISHSGDKPHNYQNFSLDAIQFRAVVGPSPQMGMGQMGMGQQMGMGAAASPSSSGTVETPFQPLVLANGFESVSWEGSQLGFSKDSCGVVHLEGFIGPGRGKLGADIFHLPPGFRPVRGKGFACQAYFPNLRRGTVGLYITPAGRAWVPVGNKPENYLNFCLDGCSFFAGPQ